MRFIFLTGAVLLSSIVIGCKKEEGTGVTGYRVTSGCGTIYFFTCYWIEFCAVHLGASNTILSHWFKYPDGMKHKTISW